MRFLMEEYIPPVPSSRPTQLDYRFLKTATNSGLEDDGVHAVRVKVKTGGGVVRDADGLSVDQSLVNQIVIEEHTITASDMTAKSFSLSQTMASTDQVAMTVYGGIPLNYGVDYTAVSSTAIGWNGLGLDGMIEAGDEVRLMYSD